MRLRFLHIIICVILIIYIPNESAASIFSKIGLAINYGFHQNSIDVPIPSLSNGNYLDLQLLYQYSNSYWFAIKTSLSASDKNTTNNLDNYLNQIGISSFKIMVYRSSSKPTSFKPYIGIGTGYTIMKYDYSLLEHYGYGNTQLDISETNGHFSIEGVLGLRLNVSKHFGFNTSFCNEISSGGYVIAFNGGIVIIF